VRQWELGFRSRIGEFGQLYGELPANILAEEILEPGDDRIRALIVSGGNPAVALPDQVKAVRALRHLDLLVTIDPRPSATAELAHYVIAPTLAFERADHTARWEMLFSEPFAQYAEQLLPRPPGVVEDWEVFWGLAHRMQTPLEIDGTSIDTTTKPAAEDLLALAGSGGQTPLADVRGHPHGVRIDARRAIVAAADPDAADHRLELVPDDVAGELAAALAPPADDEWATHSLVVRRMREVMNSLGVDVPAMRRGTYNPLWLHPDDLAGTGIVAGDTVEISSAHGTIEAIAAADATLRRGVVAMSHVWGGLPGNGDAPAARGSNPGLLISSDEHVETINRMPRMTAIPVRVALAQPSSDPRIDTNETISPG
jgi:anaerobic selenocysteine-containing dehydrogenase